MDKAYLTLGKQCYKNMTQEEKSKYKAIVEIIEKKQKRLERAHYRYKEIAGILRPEDLEIKENVTEQDIQDITVACIKKETVPQQKVDSPEIAQEDSF
jgi:cell division protein YceG involved in septum cleavage